MAQVPPSLYPAMAQCRGPVAADIIESTKRGTSTVRYVSASPRVKLSTHSVSPVNEPFGSGKTRTGATPPCVAAKRSATVAAPAARIMLSGWPGTPASMTTTGRWGRGLVKNAGGTHTYAGRATKPDTVPGMAIVLTAP